MFYIYIYIYIYRSSWFFENQPNKICSHLSETASNGRFFDPENLQNHLTKEKERRKRKREEKKSRRREKSNGCTLSFYNSYFGDSAEKKKLLNAKGPFDNNVFKNSARYKKEDKKSSPAYPHPCWSQIRCSCRHGKVTYTIKSWNSLEVWRSIARN